MTARLPLLLLLLVVAIPAPLRAQSELVIVQKGASDYHRPGCEVVRDGVGVLAMTRAQAESRKLKAHAACDPAKAPGASEKTASGKPAEELVYVDAQAKHYHREKCKRLGRDPKKMALEAAALKHWPCPVCKPPIRKRPGKT